MSIQSGSQLPYPEFRARHAAKKASPVMWQWKWLAGELEAAEHSERGTIALSRPGGTDEIVPGTAVAFQIVRPGDRTTPHTHAWWHLYVVRSGTGTVVFEESDEAADLTTGDIMLIPAWSTHYFENLGTREDLVLLNVTNLPQQADLYNFLVREKEVTADEVA